MASPPGPARPWWERGLPEESADPEVEKNPLDKSAIPNIDTASIFQHTNTDDDQKPLIETDNKSNVKSAESFGHDADDEFNLDSSLRRHAVSIVVIYLLLSMLIMALIEDWDVTTSL